MPRSALTIYGATGSRDLAKHFKTHTVHRRNARDILTNYCCWLTGTTAGEACSALFPTCVPITSPETIISTRRFSLRPLAEVLSATGRVLPRPRATTLLIETPESTR